MMSIPQKVVWKVATEEPLKDYHILCHQLQANENVADYLGKCNIEYTCGVVFITPNDSFLLSPDFMWEKMVAPSFPVCVINNIEGQKLLENIRHSEGDVLMCISDVDINSESATRSKSSSPEDLSLTLEETKG